MLPMLADGGEPEESPVTSFEDWCASMALHPEDSRAWPLYEARTGAESCPNLGDDFRQSPAHPQN